VSKIIQPNKAMARPKIRVAVLVPAGDEVKTSFAFSFSSLLMWMVRNRPDVEILRFISRSTLLPQSRIDLTKHALNSDCTHALWLDTDMMFPKDALSRLLAHQQPIVAANYVKRRMPIEPTAAYRRQKDNRMSAMFTNEESTGLQEAEFVGMGCMLTDLDVFRALPEPWFSLWWGTEDKSFAGEDVFFCYHARNMGLKVLVDHDLSKEVYHVGEFEFKHEHAVATRDFMLASGEDV
jgi:hypothetical protein